MATGHATRWLRFSCRLLLLLAGAKICLRPSLEIPVLKVLSLWQAKHSEKHAPEKQKAKESKLHAALQACR